MPQPRPEEVMVSDTITETGIANLPAPNIGQNYAGGGIVGYEEGGEIEEESIFPGVDYSMFSDPDKGLVDKFLDFGRGRIRDIPENIMGTEEERAIKQDQRRRAREYQERTGKMPYDQHLSEEEKAIQNEAGLDMALSAGGLGAIRKVGTPYIKDAAKKGLDYIKNKIKPATTKKPTKAEKAATDKADKVKAKKDKAAQKKKDDLKGTPGGVDRAIKGGLGAIKSGLGRAGMASFRGMKANPVATGIAGTVGAGFGLNALLNEGVLYGETPEEKAQREAKEIYDSPAEVEKRARAARYEAGIRAQQARADEQEAALKKRREKEMYLALALGGAKTMTGQSQFALSNAGEGLGAGVGALAAYDQNEMERMAASQAATAKAQQDMRTALMEYEMKYYDRILELDDNETYTAAVAKLDEKLAEGTLVDAKYAEAKQALLREFAGLDPQSYIANINGQQFTAAV